MTDPPAAPPVVRGGTEELRVLGAAGAAVEVHDDRGTLVAAGTVDGFGDVLARLGVTERVRGRGALLVTDLAPGTYQVRVDGADGPVEVEVLADGALPDDYDQRVLTQRLDEGYGYVEVRDGTTLGVNVALPDPARFGPGPHPTVLQYSGYHPSRPGFLTGDPALDTTLNTEANVCLHLGFAVVGVNMRGSGGSGGPFSLFGRLAALDGYDVVEVVARQPWCLRGEGDRLQVAMIGRSMPGFSQLLVATTQPPSLAAIAPAAVAGRPYVCAYPGGIPNAWLIPRLAFWEVEPPETEQAVVGGSGIHGARYEYYDAWLVEHIEAADDQRAAENQLLRGHDQNLVAAVAEGHFADHESHNRHQVYEWVEQVEVPTLLMGSWQDQDSGPGFSELPARFPASTPLRVLFANGTHEASRLPAFMRHWVAFLGEHLTGSAPAWTDEAEAYLRAVGLPGDPAAPAVPGPAPRHAGQPVPASATEPGATVQLDVGGGDPAAPGAPYPSAEVRLPAWPPTPTVARFALGPHGTLGAPPPSGAPATRWRYDPRTKPVANAHEGFDINAAVPDYDWRPLPAGHAAAFVSEPLADDLVLLGPSCLELWLICNAPDLDVEVTLTEVRPDGWETFVQNGWQRASHRRLDPVRSTELAPWPTHAEADAEPLPVGEPVRLRIPIGAAGHLVRAGSRVRVCIEAPGGNQPHWTFRPRWPDGTVEGDAVEVAVLHDEEHPSALLLAQVDVQAPPEGWPPLAPPGVLRRQPSRRYRPEGVAVEPGGPLPAPDRRDVPPLQHEANRPPEPVPEPEPVPPAPTPVAPPRGLWPRVRRQLGRVRRKVRALARRARR